MGKLAEAFKAALEQAGYEFLSKDDLRNVGLASTREMPAGVQTEFQVLFRVLGGIADWGHFRAGQWDMVTTGGLCIEFDEQLHFNRYRRLTDELSWSKHLPWAGEYLHYSAAHEDWCWKDGRRGKTWTSPATEKMFGEADPPGVFGARGSPRWKQRALYDAVKDAYSFHTEGVSMARASLHDQIGETLVHRLLKEEGNLDPEALRTFIAARTVGG